MHLGSIYLIVKDINNTAHKAKDNTIINLKSSICEINNNIN